MKAPDPVARPEPGEAAGATKFVQLCASQNDLFALDEGGDVYQYNFSTKTWVRLAAARNPEETSVRETDRRGAGARLGGSKANQGPEPGST